jgi:hypothetical protein
MKTLFDQVNVDLRASGLKSVNVYNAAIKSALASQTDILDYAYRIGDEEVFAYDIFSSTRDSDDLDSLFVTTINNLKAELIIIEINGDINSEFNTKIIKECDAILNIFNCNMASMDAVKEYKDTFDKHCVLRTGYICQKYDANTLSESRVAKAIDNNRRTLMTVPYNGSVIVESYNRNLNSLAALIAKGDASVIALRMKLLEIMQYLFDTGKYKYIKGIDTWYK